MTSAMATPAGTDEALTTTPTPSTTPAPAAAAVGGPREGRAKRRTFTSDYKRRIVAEYDAAPNGTKGAVLRRERLYDSHVQEWRAAIAAGTVDEPLKGGRPPKTAEQARIVELERHVTRLEAEAVRKDQVIADRDAALEVLGKGVAFLEAIASKNTR